MVSPADTSQMPEAAAEPALQRRSLEATSVTGLLLDWAVSVEDVAWGGWGGEGTYGGADTGVGYVLAVDPELLEGGVGGRRRGGREGKDGGLHGGW